MNQLKQLYENVHMGTAKQQDFDDAFGDVCQDTDLQNLATLAMDAYRGSLDAGFLLAESLAPNVPIMLTDHSPEWCGAVGWKATINWPAKQWFQSFQTDPRDHSFHEYHQIRSRALLLALLYRQIYVVERG